MAALSGACTRHDRTTGCAHQRRMAQQNVPMWTSTPTSSYKSWSVALCINSGVLASSSPSTQHGTSRPHYKQRTTRIFSEPRNGWLPDSIPDFVYGRMSSTNGKVHLSLTFFVVNV